MFRNVCVWESVSAVFLFSHSKAIAFRYDVGRFSFHDLVLLRLDTDRISGLLFTSSGRNVDVRVRERETTVFWSYVV